MQNHEPSSYRLDSYSSLVESDLRQLLQKEPKLELYRMIEYFLGFRDQNGGEVERYGGKRLRPAICLYIADLFGKKEAARLFASSLELFHNFTLIHDDIEDHDELRRGRPTVWKLWGVNHGINSGDALGLLATKTLGRAAAKAGENGQKAAAFLSQIYAEVIEGQFLDFTLADALLSSPAVTEESYLRMIEKKSAVLIAASAKAGAMIAGASPACQEALWRYGFNLGRPYQIYDDIVSIWGSIEKSGKTALKDIYEKKKTLPVIFGYSCASAAEKKELEEIYSTGHVVSEEEVRKVVGILNKVDAREYAHQKLLHFATLAKKALGNTGLSKTSIQPLLDLEQSLLFSNPSTTNRVKVQLQ